MNRFGIKDSNLISQLNEAASSDKMSEFDLQFSINELASILRNAQSIENKIIYTAEAVPVFIYENGDSTKYIIEQENLIKLMDSQHIDAGTAVKHIKESLEEHLDDAIEFNNVGFDLGDFSVLFNKEDIDALSATCYNDPVKSKVRTEAVSKYNNFIESIIDEGAKVIFIEK